MIRITNWKKFITLVISFALIIILVGVVNSWRDTTIIRSGGFTIAEGTPATTVWNNLVNEGFTNSKLSWRYQSWQLDAANQIKSGTYQLEAGETTADVINRFIKGDAVPDELSLVFPEGFTLNQIADRTAAKGIGTANQFLAEAIPANFSSQFHFLADIPDSRTLEGYLFPDTYRVFEDDQPDDLIVRMLSNFNRKLTPDLQADLTTSGHTLDEIVIMASIVEREVQTDEDMATVAGILWKRLDEGMGLDVDATVRYALDKWTQPLTVNDLAVESPYNTRKYAGLPPGPISNPGLRALMATIRPES
jgi:UPF0755 protein